MRVLAYAEDRVLNISLLVSVVCDVDIFDVICSLNEFVCAGLLYVFFLNDIRCCRFTVRFTSYVSTSRSTSDARAAGKRQTGLPRKVAAVGQCQGTIAWSRSERVAID